MPEQEDEIKPVEAAEKTEISKDLDELPADEQATSDSDAGEPQTELGESEKVTAGSEPPKPVGKFKRFFAGYWHHKKWTLPLTLLAVVAIVFAVPQTRYKLLALEVKRSFGVTVFDSKTHKAVSGARVTLDGQALTTNNAGDVTFRIKVGHGTVVVDKKYYKSLSESVFVGLRSKTNATTVQLIATGRQVPVSVINKITGKPVANAEIKVLDTEAKTDASGKAIIVLPTVSPTQTAAFSASGYNSLAATVQVTSSIVSGNAFQLTPSGSVYFLSNLSGKIDVVSTGLDGSNRQTVLAGTGKEDQQNTVLLAARDWKYLALLSTRDGGQNAKLFLINTATNQTTVMDSGAASFTPVGWAGHDFIYEAAPTGVSSWQSGQYVLKSFNADTGKITVLDQTTAQGTSNDDFIGQDFGYGYGGSNDIYIVGNNVVYIKEWGAGFSANGSVFGSKQDQILSVTVDGSGKQVLQSFAMPTNGINQSINSVAYSPSEIYFQVDNGSGNVYYAYTNSTVTQSNTITNDLFQQAQQGYATFLESPSGDLTFWAEPRDGKNTLFVGDANGANGKQIATLSDYTSYGWYTDNYLLVEKNGSELYVIPVAGGAALKISDYYKPAQNFNGYGGGYGGL